MKGSRILLRWALASLALAALIAVPFALKPYGTYLLSMWAVMAIAAIGSISHSVMRVRSRLPKAPLSVWAPTPRPFSLRTAGRSRWRC